MEVRHFADRVLVVQEVGLRRAFRSLSLGAAFIHSSLAIERSDLSILAVLPGIGVTTA